MNTKLKLIASLLLAVSITNATTVEDAEDIKVIIHQDGKNLTKQVTVNGKELNSKQIEEFEASGKMKVFHIKTDDADMENHKMIYINSDADYDDIDMDEIMSHIGDLNEDSDNVLIKNIWIGDDDSKIKIIKKKFLMNDNERASLGFMANVKDDGWHLTTIVDGSGAQEAGIQAGDIVIKIADVDMAHFDVSDSEKSKRLPEFEVGEMVIVELIRDGELMDFDVKATILNKDEMFVNIISEIEELHNIKGLDSKNFKVMVFNGDDDSYRLNEDDIHMLFPEHLGEMNLFISDGKSTSSLLGKHHEMSSLSSGLASYFGTRGGVLVMHVDESNVFALEDGDVIKSVNGNEVSSPKDVIKQLLNSKEQEQIKLKIVRHKRNKTLKYNK